MTARKNMQKILYALNHIQFLFLKLYHLNHNNKNIYINVIKLNCYWLLLYNITIAYSENFIKCDKIYSEKIVNKKTKCER